MEIVAIIYILLGLLLAEGSFKAVRDNPDKYPDYSFLSYIAVLVFWPLLLAFVGRRGR